MADNDEYSTEGKIIVGGILVIGAAYLLGKYLFGDKEENVKPQVDTSIPPPRAEQRPSHLESTTKSGKKEKLYSGDQSYMNDAFDRKEW